MSSDSGDTWRRVIRVPAKEALGGKLACIVEECRRGGELGKTRLRPYEAAILADEVCVALVLVIEGIEVLLDLEPHGRRRRVRKEVLQLVVVHGTHRCEWSLERGAVKLKRKPSWRGRCSSSLERRGEKLEANEWHFPTQRHSEGGTVFEIHLEVQQTTWLQMISHGPRCFELQTVQR